MSVSVSLVRSLVEEIVRAGADPDAFLAAGGVTRCNRMRAEFGITCVVKIAELFFGSSQKPLAVEFEHGAPSYAAEYAAVLGCPVRFGCTSTRIVMDRRILDAPQRHANAEIF